MRRPNREISIFTLSALDVLAMSAGVFVLLLVMLMPYHRKVLDAHAALEAARIADADTVARVQTLEELATLHRAEAEAAEAEAAALLASAASLQRAAAERRQQALPAAPGTSATSTSTTPVIEAIDLIFVIDTTASMAPVLHEVARSLRGIVRILEAMVPSVRVGVVAYNDRDTGQVPVVTLPPTPTDRGLPRVVAFIEGLSASTIGSRTVDEDLYLGLTPRRPCRCARRPSRRSSWSATPKPIPTSRRRRCFARRASCAATTNRSISTLFVTTPSSLMHGNVARAFFVALANAGGGASTITPAA